MNPNMVLHQWEVSPFCGKVRRMLDFKGLRYDVINYNGLRGLLAQRLSPVGKLPVLAVNGERIQDSTRIARVLDERFAESPLYPTNPRQRALAELWEDWADEALYFYDVYFRITDPAVLDRFIGLICAGRPAAEKRVLKPLFKAAGITLLKTQGLGRMSREEVEAEFGRHLDRIETTLKSTGRLVGKTMTIADLAVASQLLEIRRTTPEHLQLDRRLRLADWLDCMG